jgi:ABC-type microcin C transport system duplicated ATPase subunit YejF
MKLYVIVRKFSDGSHVVGHGKVFEDYEKAMMLLSEIKDRYTNEMTSKYYDENPSTFHLCVVYIPEE